MTIIAKDSGNIPRFLLTETDGTLDVKITAEIPAGDELIGKVELTDGTTDVRVDSGTAALQVIEQGNPVVHVQGHDGSQWRNISVDSNGKVNVSVS